MKRKLYLLWGIALSALLIVACATGTKLTSVWNDEFYQGGKVSKVMIIGVSKNPEVRQTFEDEFVKQLTAQGSMGVPSYPFIADDKRQDKKTIVRHVMSHKVDAVLITKLIAEEDVANYKTPEHQNIQTQYFSSYNYVFDVGYVEAEKPVCLETNLFNARTGKLIWSSLSKTFKRGSDEKTIASFIKTITGELSEQGLI